MYDMDPDAIRAQQEALASFEAQRFAQQGQLQELESAALASAIAASEHEALTRAEEESAQLAQSIHSQEVAAADEELATALEKSERYAKAEDAGRSLAESAFRLRRSRTSDRHEGSWDCLHCTFTNQPYRPACAMCATPAPPTVLVFKAFPPLRFGLEIEILVPDGKLDGFTFEKIANDLTRMGPRVDFAGYSHETSPNWKIVTDSSISGQDSDLGFELVSPVLEGEGIKGLASLRAIMDNVRRLGIATNSSCGFHVHVDASRNGVPQMGTVNGLMRVAQCFVALENAFDLLVALSWHDNETHGRRTNQNRYCRSNRFEFGALSNRQRWEKIGSVSNRRALVEMINPGGDRYRKLNLTNITNPSRPSTCEFRHHGGVEELREAEAWVRLISRFCQKASQGGNNVNACLLSEGATPKEELEALFTLLDCPGLEQFFMVERRLFANGRLHNIWTCPRCERSFGNSRALSQHAQATGHY